MRGHIPQASVFIFLVGIITSRGIHKYYSLLRISTTGMGQCCLKRELCGFWMVEQGLQHVFHLIPEKTDAQRNYATRCVCMCACAHVCACVLTQRAGWQRGRGLCTTRTASKATSRTLATNLNSLSNKHRLKMAQAVCFCSSYSSSTSKSYSDYAGGWQWISSDFYCYL